MTKSELIAKLSEEIPALKSMKPQELEDTITSLVTKLSVLQETNQEADEFWQEKSLEQLAREQNVKPIEKWEDFFGKGADLWEDEKDFQAFLLATEGKDVEEPRK
ncbi:MAG TPA: hypothetical protein VM658_12165 [bacterium]|nr:hypothetical protein [bacterium]